MNKIHLSCLFFLVFRSGQAIPLQQHPPAGQLPPPPVTRKTHTRRDSGQQRALVDRDPGPAGPPGPTGPLPAQQQTQQSVTQVKYQLTD